MQVAEEERRVAERGAGSRRCSTTRKMKKTTVWATCLRSRFVWSSGRMRSIDAPVVPMNDASSAPAAEERGVGARRRLEVALHEDAARDHEQRAEQDDERDVVGGGLDERRRALPAGTGRARAPRAPPRRASLRRFDSQKCGAARGRTAIESSMATNGRAHATPGTNAGSCMRGRSLRREAALRPPAGWPRRMLAPRRSPGDGPLRRRRARVRAGRASARRSRPPAPGGAWPPSSARTSSAATASTGARSRRRRCARAPSSSTSSRSCASTASATRSARR